MEFFLTTVVCLEGIMAQINLPFIYKFVHFLSTSKIFRILVGQLLLNTWNVRFLSLLTSRGGFCYSSSNNCFMCAGERRRLARILPFWQRCFNLLMFLSSVTDLHFSFQTLELILCQSADLNFDVENWKQALITAASFMLAPPPPYSADSALTPRRPPCWEAWDMKQVPLNMPEL